MLPFVFENARCAFMCAALRLADSAAPGWALLATVRSEAGLKHNLLELKRLSAEWQERYGG